MKRTTLIARLLVCMMAVAFCTWKVMSCADDLAKDIADVTYCTVTFVNDDGSEIERRQVEAGKRVGQPAAPTKDGYTFLGWFVGDDAFDFTTSITENITLTAKWEAAETPGGDGSDPIPGIDPSKPSGPLVTPSDPMIGNPVAGGPVITKASAGELETAYVEWTAADNAKWYNVYVKSTSAGEWTRLDGPLVREYKDCFRADALGLQAGTYDMKVVPVSGDGTEATEYASTATGMAVYAHDRAGYAFTGGNVPGAYNRDGTLKAGAQVVYVTAANAKTVKAIVGGIEVTGFQSILDARAKGATDPIAFRIVGMVTKDDLDHISSSEEGLQIKGKSKTVPAENITVEGVGSDGTIKDFGILTRYCKNVEIRNLGILNCMDDGISIDTDNSHLWVHNNDIFYGKKGSGDKAKGDGALDTKGSTLITHSYNHFWDCGKCNLQGMKSERTDYRITYHHNWYDHSDSRHPRIRTATVHVYNNYYDGNAKYGVGVTTGASAFVESNYFRSTAPMRPMMSSGQGTDAAGEKGTFSGETGGMIKAYGNTYDCPPAHLRLMTQADTAADNIDCYEASSRGETVPAMYRTKSGGTTYNNFDTATDMYEYEVDTAEQAREKVMRYAGRVGGGDLTWTFDNATEDKNYDIIPGLSAAVIGYTGSVVRIGDGTASDPGGSGGDSDKEEEKPVTPPLTPPATGAAVVALVANGAVSPTDPRVTCTACSVNSNVTNGAISIEYDGVTYTTVKMESKSIITVRATVGATITVIGSLPSGTQSCFKRNNVAVKLDAKTTEDTTTFQQSFTATGNDVITKGDKASIGVIIIAEAE